MKASGENCIHQFRSAIKYFVHVVVYIIRGRAFGGGGELREKPSSIEAAARETEIKKTTAEGGKNAERKNLDGPKGDFYYYNICFPSVFKTASANDNSFERVNNTRDALYVRCSIRRSGSSCEGNKQCFQTTCKIKTLQQ